MTDTTTTAVPAAKDVRETLALDLVDWWHAYGSDAAWEVTGERLSGDLGEAARAFVDHAVAALDGAVDSHVGWIVAERYDGDIHADMAFLHPTLESVEAQLATLAHYGTYTVYRLSAETGS